MADKFLYENNCGEDSRASAKHRAHRSAVRTESTASGLAVAASLNSVWHILAFPGSRLAKPSAGFTR